MHNVHIYMNDMHMINMRTCIHTEHACLFFVASKDAKRQFFWKTCVKLTEAVLIYAQALAI